MASAIPTRLTPSANDAINSGRNEPMNPTAKAVEHAHQSVTEYWTRLYAEAEQEAPYSIAQDSDLGRQHYYLSDE